MRWILVAAIFVAGAAGAEPVPINQVTDEINGREVAISGKFGRNSAISDASYRLYVSDVGFYPIELALDRENLASVRDCNFEDMGMSSACDVDMKAEIAVRGASIELIAYEITKR